MAQIPANPSVDVENLKPFKKFIMTIGNLPTSYLESLTYAELVMWFCNYLQETVIPTVNNNGGAVEEIQELYVELKTYVDDYFTNLDVQEEINNKLDEMASDGTFDSIININILNNLKQCSPTTYITPTLVAQAQMPASGYYTQSFCNDGTYTYIFFTNGNTVKARKYIGVDFSNAILENTYASMHANSCCIYKDKIYVSNFTTRNRVDIINTSDLQINKSITLPQNARAFAIYESTYEKQLMVCIQRYENADLRYYQIMENYKLEPRNVISTLPIRGNRNGIKHIQFDGYDCMAFCIGNNSVGMKGNIICLNPTNQRDNYYISIENSGEELQDIMQIGNTAYIINSAGEIYSMDLSNIFPSTWTGAVYHTEVSGQGSILKNAYINLDEMDITQYPDGNYTYEFKVATKFYVAPFFNEILMGFNQADKCITVLSEGTYNTSLPGNIKVPINRTLHTDDNIYIMEGYLLYEYKEGTSSIINGGRTYYYELNKDQVSLRLMVIPRNLTGNIIVNRYSFNQIKNYMSTNNVNNLLHNCYPYYAYGFGTFGKSNIQNAQDWITFS